MSLFHLFNIKAQTTMIEQVTSGTTTANQVVSKSTADEEVIV